jgi:hypothetical protein
MLLSGYEVESTTSWARTMVQNNKMVVVAVALAEHHHHREKKNEEGKKISESLRQRMNRSEIRNRSEKYHYLYKKS